MLLHLFPFPINNGCCITKSRPLLDFNRKCFETKVSASISIIFSYWYYPSPCLSSCLSVYTTSGTLRASSDGEKNSFSCKDGNFRALVTGHYRSFSVQAPLIWIKLPADIRHCSSLSQFRFFSWKLSPYFCLLWATLTNLHWIHRWNKNGLLEFYAWLLAMPCLFVSALYKWNVTKTNSGVHFKGIGE